MFRLILELLLLCGLLPVFLYCYLLLPPAHPHNIPAIPFWVALIPFFRDVDQSDIFRRYIAGPLRTHGAVKLFFGGQWCVLVHRPAYLVEMFRDETVYNKSGNQKKIPHSVLAEFLGDNIISSRGDDWKAYQSIMKPGLQRKFDVAVLAGNADRLCALVADASRDALALGGETKGGRGVPVQDLLQRYSVANCAQGLLQTDLHTLTSADSAVNRLQMLVKREIFKPVFMNFPFLDRLPLASRARARRLVAEFKNELKSALVASHAARQGDARDARDGAPPATAARDELGGRLLGALESGALTEKQFLDNLTVTFVAGQENPQLHMISTLYLLAKHPEAQDQLRSELEARQLLCSGSSNHGNDPDEATLQDLPYMTSVIYESLRLFPPIGQLVNRRAGRDTLLGGEVFVPAGMYLGYNCYSTNRDPEAWGGKAGADEFCPGRWGAGSEEIRKEYRRRRARGEFVSFHGGSRACLGERFAVLEMRVTLRALASRFRWRLDPTWIDRKTPAGPLYPRALRLVFEERACK